MARHSKSFSILVVLMLLMGMVLAACGTQGAVSTVESVGEDVAEVATQANVTEDDLQDAAATATAVNVTQDDVVDAVETVLPTDSTDGAEATVGVTATVGTEATVGATGTADVGAGPIGAEATTSACAPRGDTSKGSLKIFASLPLTGPSRNQTESAVNGMRLALEDYQGAVAGYEVEFTALDDATAAAGQWTAEAETANANRAVSEGATAYLATFNSGAAAVSIPIMNEAGIPMISPANTAINLTRPGAPNPELYESLYQNGPRNYFRVVPNDRLQGAAAATWAQELGAENVFILHDQEVYGLGLAQVFQQTARELGVNVVGFEGINPDAGNYSALMQRIVNQGTDLVFFGGLTDTGGPALLRDLRDIVDDPEEVKFMGPDGILDIGFIEGVGADIAEGAYGTVAAAPPAQLQGSGAEFYEKYREEFGKEPQPYAIFGYDTMGVALTAIEQACSKDPADVLEALNNLGEYTGALGTFSFDENGDTTLTAYHGYVVQDGEWTWKQELSVEAATE